MRNIQLKLGETVRKRRSLLKLRQPELAAIAGVGTRTIQDIEAGKGNPSLDILLKIANVLGLSLTLELKDPVREYNNKEAE